jgi:molybdopterin molybdotransferase
MLSVAEARVRILAQFQPVATESIPLIACANRVLAADVRATNDFPAFNNSSMDGFAIRSTDSSSAADSRVTLRVVDDIPAGSIPKTIITKGEAARIMTGAQIPEGADAVIAVEDTDFDARAFDTQAPQTISFTRPVQAGENIRARGMDMHAGDVVLKKGRTLKPQGLGLLATLGTANAEVYKKPRTALLSSGDELLPISVALEPGKVRDSNTYTLTALVESTGAEVLSLGVALDNRESITALFEKAADERVDLILSTAGVSVGAFDYIKGVVESKGKLDFWKVNMRPGKPLAFGEYRGINFIGLPGNPVSAFVGFEIFVRDALNKLSGRSDGNRIRVRVRCEQQIESDGRESYLRGMLREENGIQYAKLTGHQGSGNLLSLVEADALLIIPAGVKCVPAGQEVQALLL